VEPDRQRVHLTVAGSINSGDQRLAWSALQTVLGILIGKAVKPTYAAIDVASGDQADTDQHFPLEQGVLL
jgi:hypothetical protein